jgi:hypothetical protein
MHRCYEVTPVTEWHLHRGNRSNAERNVLHEHGIVLSRLSQLVEKGFSNVASGCLVDCEPNAVLVVFCVCLFLGESCLPLLPPGWCS